ncbi:MAG TPA: AAA family ATPase [Candidatus Binataceae bacterium]|nr:AAA family ATPase [Candidatus Binataceae bacterium]
MARLGKVVGRRDFVRVHLVGESEQQRAAIGRALTEVVDPPLETFESQPHPGSDNGFEADLAMVIFSENAAAPLAYLQTQAERARRPRLLALLQDRSPALMRSALHAGADEVLFMPLDEGELTRELLKISENRRKSERIAGGRLFSVVSLAGGVGVTSVSANLALALRSTMDRTAAVVDLDLQSGAVAGYLHLEPEQSIVSLVDVGRKLDSIKLESALTKHRSGIYMLAAPRRIEDSELVSDITVGAALDLMRQLFEYVVVDCGGRVDGNTVAAWERSDEVLYVVEQSVISARTAPHFMELFGRLGLRGLEPKLVLNKFESHSSVSVEKVEELAGSSVYARIPRDDWAYRRLELRPEDLWQLAPSAELTRATEMLARRLGPRRDPAPEPAGGLMARFLSVLGARA